jgi:hypothetical protein
MIREGSDLSPLLGAGFELVKRSGFKRVKTPLWVGLVKRTFLLSVGWFSKVPVWR